jgi:integrase
VRQSLGTDRRGGYNIKSTKTGRERVIPLSPAAIDALRSLRVRQAREKLAAGGAYDDRGFVFTDPFGHPVKLDAATKTFVAAARRLGISGVTLHSCRRAVATWALTGGNDVRSVAALLGAQRSIDDAQRLRPRRRRTQERAVAAISEPLVCCPGSARGRGEQTALNIGKRHGFFERWQPNGNRGKS